MLHDPYTWHRVTIIDRVVESPHAVSIRTTLPTPYPFRPGQHAVVKVPLSNGTHSVRQYSFASSPHSAELWFTIVRSRGGAVSSWFVDTSRIGDHLEISQPFLGPLCQPLLSQQRVCMIAGGSGIVPIMSHLRDLRIAGADTSLTILYSTRSTEQCFQSELTPTRSHEIIIRRETDRDKRFIPDEIAAHLAPSDKVLICGSRSFVTAMRQTAEMVVPPTHISCEAFSLT